MDELMTNYQNLPACDLFSLVMSHSSRPTQKQNKIKQKLCENLYIM